MVPNDSRSDLPLADLKTMKQNSNFYTRNEYKIRETIFSSNDDVLKKAYLGSRTPP